MDKLSLNWYLKKVEADASTKLKYRKRYEEVQGKIAARWYYINSIDHIVVHITIPSEKVNVNYDVLVEFPFGKESATFRNFKNSSIKVYSNCPSFVYMNARLFDKKGFLIPWTKILYDKATFETKEATEGEPVKEYDVRYEKSLYFAALYLDSFNAIQILTFMREAVKIPRPDAIIQYLRSPDKAMFDRVVQGVKEKEKKKQAVKKATNVSNDLGKIVNAKAVTKVSHTASTSKVGSSKKIKHI